MRLQSTTADAAAGGGVVLPVIAVALLSLMASCLILSTLNNFSLLLILLVEFHAVSMLTSGLVNIVCSCQLLTVSVSLLSRVNCVHC